MSGAIVVPSHVILAPRFADFHFGAEIFERYEIHIPEERLDEMPPRKRSFIKGAPKRLRLTKDYRERPKWRPLPPLFSAGGLMMTDALAKILERFEIGPVLIRPVELSAPKGADQGRS